MYRKLVFVTIILSIPVVLFAKQFRDLNFTGLYTQQNHIKLYYSTSVDLAAVTCSRMMNTVKIGAASSVVDICEATCRRSLNPDWFLTFVAFKIAKRPLPGKIAKIGFKTVPMEGAWEWISFRT